MPAPQPHAPLRATGTALALAVLCSTASAQQPVQIVRPPQSQAWIDVATFSGLGLPTGMTGGSAGSGAMGMLGGLIGGALGRNSFGQTQSMSAGRFVDVTLFTRNNPQLTDAQQDVPANFLSPALKLKSPKETRGTVPPETGEDKVTEAEYERPKGRMLLYWGCSETVRPGQPRVVDFANATPADLARFFQSRRATQRGTHSAVGRPVWPSTDDTRMVPPQASLVGEHTFSGAGVPDGFRFQLPPAQDLMPAIALKQTAQPSGGLLLEWQALPTARAYFISGVGAHEAAGGSSSGSGNKGDAEMVLWTSSEQPDIGFGLMDYQTNPAVDRWLKEQVLLAPATTRCAVPPGVFSGQGAMLRMIAYGSELNLAYPPRPTDPRTPWEPVWAAKVRVKSQTTAMVGMDSPAPAPAEQEKPRAPGVKDLLRGILGR